MHYSYEYLIQGAVVLVVGVIVYYLYSVAAKKKVEKKEWAGIAISLFLGGALGCFSLKMIKGERITGEVVVGK